MKRVTSGIALPMVLSAVLATAAGRASGQTVPVTPGSGDWQTLGLMRVRDMTPFGISRLDMLPAHAVSATPGTFAIEVNWSYQNTWAVSHNVKKYLEARGVERQEIGPSDIASIKALLGDAYLVDGEFGLVDLTLHYRVSPRFAFYATVPYFTFDGGFLDSTIERFHKAVGISDADRNFVPRNRFVAVVDLAHTSIVLDHPPGNRFGDPVLGVRYSPTLQSNRWKVVLEGAVKLALEGSDQLVSTGSNDYGAQVSLQRFFSRNALYLSLSGVYYQTPDPGLAGDLWIPTLVAGWETRVSKHTNFILQYYVSRSTVQRTKLDELSATKNQATVGLQRYYHGCVMRFGITENVANFDNTPDAGFNVSFARILLGSPRDRAGASGGTPRRRNGSPSS